MLDCCRSFIIAFSLFTRLPMPKVEWNEKRQAASVIFLPVIGIVIGAFEVLMLIITDKYKVPYPAVSLLYMAIPIIITGGIHLDGLIDTADARSSYKDMEKKHEILKDPHVGAFGIIRLLLYIMLALACLLIIFEKKVSLPLGEAAVYFSLPFVLSRSFLGIAVMFFKGYDSNGMLSMLKEGNRPFMRIIMCIEAVVFSIAVFIVLGISKGIITVALQVAFFIYFKHFAYKQFGGLSGDLCGWYLCISELLFGLGVIL